MTTCKHHSCTDAPSHKKAGFCRFHYDKRHSLGLTSMVDAGPVIAHVEALRELGWLFREIGQAAGVPAATVSAMIRVPKSTARQRTAAGILAIAPVSCVDSAATRRRLQALSRLGWPQGTIARRAGFRFGTVDEAKRAKIPPGAAEKIAQVYEELSHLPGPSRRIKSYSKTMGWLPPSAWVDIEAGVPLCVSPIGARRRVQALFALGHTYMAIAAASGLGRQTVFRIAVGLDTNLMPETVDKILTGFEALSTVLGTCRPNVKLARERNWGSPAMWDDIDDLNESLDFSVDPDDVDELLVERFLKGAAEPHHLSAAEQAEAVKQLKKNGLDPEQIAIRMHWNWKTKADRKAAA